MSKEWLFNGYGMYVGRGVRVTRKDKFFHHECGNEVTHFASEKYSPVMANIYFGGKTCCFCHRGLFYEPSEDDT